MNCSTFFVLVVLVLSLFSLQCEAHKNSVKLINTKNGKRPSTTTTASADDDEYMRVGKAAESIAMKMRENGVFGWDMISCTICKDSVFLLQKAVLANMTEEEVVKLATRLCIDLKIQDEAVCTGIVSEFKDEFMTVLADKLFTPSSFCSFFKFCAPQNHTSPHNMTFPKPKPPHVPPTPPQPNTPKKYIVQFTDIHWDPLYTPGTNTDCGEPLCCRQENGPGNAGVWGDYHCDPPLKLIEHLFDFVANNLTTKPDYIFWTGDNPPHDVWKQSREWILTTSNTLSNLFNQYFPASSKIGVFPALGNHESYPINSFPAPPKDSWVLKDLAREWSQWIDSDAQASMAYGGYYTALMEKGLRVISVNMNYCNTGNFWLLLNDTDPAGELEWLINTLQDAEDNKEKVFIVGHIAPGSSDCLIQWGLDFQQIINRYEDTIIAQFYGHTHKDSFEVFYDPSSNKTRATSIAYVTPSVTTYMDINPSFRVFELDMDTRSISEITTYMCNISKANELGYPTWEVEYVTRETYGMQYLFPQDWADLTNRLHDDQELLSLYTYYHYTSNTKKKCDDKNCRKSTLCELQSGAFQDVIDCMGNDLDWATLMDILENDLC